jgi:hypothetical protein
MLEWQREGRTVPDREYTVPLTAWEVLALATLGKATGDGWSFAGRVTAQGDKALLTGTDSAFAEAFERLKRWGPVLLDRGATAEDMANYAALLIKLRDPDEQWSTNNSGQSVPIAVSSRSTASSGGQLARRASSRVSAVSMLWGAAIGFLFACGLLVPGLVRVATLLESGLTVRIPNPLGHELALDYYRTATPIPTPTSIPTPTTTPRPSPTATVAVVYVQLPPPPPVTVVTTVVVTATPTPPVCSPMIDTRVDGQFTGWTGQTLFKFQNQQQWQQDGSGYILDRLASPHVQIYSVQGQCRLAVDGIASTVAVVRVK